MVEPDLKHTIPTCHAHFIKIQTPVQMVIITYGNEANAMDKIITITYYFAIDTGRGKGLAPFFFL